MCFKRKRHVNNENSNVELLYAEYKVKRDEQYTRLLTQYVDNQKRLNRAQVWFKSTFFLVVCIAFLGVIIVGIWGIFKIAEKTKTELADVATVIAGFGSILSAIIVLPDKIATHLFPAGGDKETLLEFVKSMQAYDKKKEADGSISDVIIEIDKPKTIPIRKRGNEAGEEAFTPPENPS